jgi:glyoxylase-like metal-dependent hydrolase (beta-lactamase superfamily II)
MRRAGQSFGQYGRGIAVSVAELCLRQTRCDPKVDPLEMRTSHNLVRAGKSSCQTYSDRRTVGIKCQQFGAAVQQQENVMSKRDIALSRRGLMAGASFAAVAGAVGLMPHEGAAMVQMPTDQVPYYYRFKLGDSEATIVSDGILPLGDPAKSFLGLTKEEISQQLTENFLPTNNIVLEQNVLVINIGGKTVLFDTGMGSMKLFGPTTGQLVMTLRAANIDPNGIDAVVMSHAHIDHCGGIMADDGTSHFPNAQLYITQADYDYWTDESTVGPKFKMFYEQAHKNLTPNRDRIHFVKEHEELVPGVTALYAPGHTVGHTIFMINSGGKSLCYIGDLTHHPVLLMQKPLTEFVADTDPKQSAQTRVRMLTMLADNRIPVLAYHFAWPGMGHVVKLGDGFRYLPAPMQMMELAS